MRCPSCQETYSDLQSICPACFVSLEPDKTTEAAPSPFDGLMKVDWPEPPDVSKMMADLAAGIPESSANVLDAALARVPDESARDVAREKLEEAARNLEAHLPGQVRVLAHDRLEKTVDRLASRVPDRNLRQAARQEVEPLYRAAAEGRPGQAARTAQERAKEFDAWYRQNASNTEAPTAPSVDLNANLGAMRLIVAFISIMIAGFGQVVYGPRGVGLGIMLVWFVLLGTGQLGLLLLLGLISALVTLIGAAIKRT